MRHFAFLLVLLCGCRTLTHAEVKPHGSVYAEADTDKTTVRYGVKIEF